MYLLSLDPVIGNLIPAETARLYEQVCDACGIWGGALGRRLYHSPRFLRLGWATSGKWFPGHFAHFPVRKKFIASRVSQALEKGAAQVINVGAGYDCLLLSLARSHPERSFFEIDHPNTSQSKRKGLEKMGQPSNLTLAAADLSREKMADVLDRSGFARGKDNVFIAEGLLSYLEEEAVRAFFTAIRELSARALVVCTYCEADEKGRFDLGPLGWLANFSLHLAGERLNWGIRREQAADFMAGLGFSVVEQHSSVEMIREYLGAAAGPLPSQSLENFLIAAC